MALSLQRESIVTGLNPTIFFIRRDLLIKRDPFFYFNGHEDLYSPYPVKGMNPCLREQNCWKQCRIPIHIRIRTIQ